MIKSLFYNNGKYQFIQWTAPKQIPAGIGQSTLRHKNKKKYHILILYVNHEKKKYIHEWRMVPLGTQKTVMLVYRHKHWVGVNKN